MAGSAITGSTCLPWTRLLAGRRFASGTRRSFPATDRRSAFPGATGRGRRRRAGTPRHSRRWPVSVVGRRFRSRQWRPFAPRSQPSHHHPLHDGYRGGMDPNPVQPIIRGFSHDDIQANPPASVDGTANRNPGQLGLGVEILEGCRARIIPDHDTHPDGFGEASNR